jgi:hypothetical protein
MANGPYTIHDTIKCHRFEKDGTLKDKPVDSLSAKSILAGEKLIATYSISM